MAPHSSTLAWKIPWMEEPGGLQSMGLQRVGHDWATSLSLFHFHALEKEMATHSSVLAWRVPGMGEPGGLPSMGSHRVRHNWSDLAVAVAIKVLWYWWRASLVTQMVKNLLAKLWCQHPQMQHISTLLSLGHKRKMTFTCIWTIQLLDHS